MTTDQPSMGKEGDTCPGCGSALATDQRYCLNCGLRRGETRVDYETQIMRGGQPATAGASAGPAQTAAVQWNNPIFAIGAIAVLGIMLLLGVLIGKDNNGTTQTVAAQAPATTTTAAAPTTDTTAATPAAKAAKGATAAAAPGQGNVVQGGSGSTAGIQTADTSKSPQETAKGGPDVVATGGKPAALDPNGQAGNGSSATCIGC